MAATSGSRRATSAKVPWVPSTGAVDRGNSSYHEPKRARSRSTSTASSGWVVAAVRSDRRSISASSGAQALPKPARSIASRGWARSGGARRCGPARRRPPPRPASAPMASSTATSWPASILARVAAIQVRKGSIHAWTVKRWRPRPLTGKVAVHRSLPRGRNHTSAQRRPGGRWRTTPMIVSWPSAKTSAVTSTASPATRLTGKRPAVDLRGDVLDDHPAGREGVGDAGRAHVLVLTARGVRRVASGQRRERRCVRRRELRRRWVDLVAVVVDHPGGREPRAVGLEAVADPVEPPAGHAVGVAVVEEGDDLALEEVEDGGGVAAGPGPRGRHRSRRRQAHPLVPS